MSNATYYPLQGVFSSPIFNYLSIKLNYCSSSTCYNRTAMQKLSNDILISYRYFDFYIDPSAKNKFPYISVNTKQIENYISKRIY